jgi:micrococcal nuclease
VRLGGHEERVRLLGIDTPETHKPDAPVECFGPEAADRLGSLLPAGTVVRLVRDIEARDRYDRLLAYVYRDRDGLFVDLAMVADGYAGTLTISPNVAHRAELDRAAADARSAQRGLWHTCGGNHVVPGR